jgi:sulfonate transport system substrate-binding protein
MIARRTLLAAASTLAVAPKAFAADTLLRAGDQKGGTQSLMKAAGALDNLPYRLEWSQFPAAAPLLEALNADAIDLAFAGDAPTTFALAAGLRSRIIAPIRTTGAGTAIMVPKDSAIRSVADLKGHRIATNRGSIGHALVLSVLTAQGWSAADITLVNLMPSEAKTALSTGAVDAWCSWGVYVAQARLVDQARVVVDGSNGLLTGLSYLVAADIAIATRRPALLDFARRLAVARRWATAHPDAYARVLARARRWRCDRGRGTEQRRQLERPRWGGESAAAAGFERARRRAG